MFLIDYINQFYNQKWLYSGIGYISPAEYERVVMSNETYPFCRGKISFSLYSDFFAELWIRFV